MGNIYHKMVKSLVNKGKTLFFLQTKNPPSSPAFSKFMRMEGKTYPAASLNEIYNF